MSNILNVPFADGRLVNAYNHPWDYIAPNTIPALVNLPDPVTGDPSGTLEIIWPTGALAGVMFDENTQGLGTPTQLQLNFLSGVGTVRVDVYQANAPTTNLSGAFVSTSGASNHTVTLSGGTSNSLITVILTATSNSGGLVIGTIQLIF